MFQLFVGSPKKYDLPKNKPIGTIAFQAYRKIKAYKVYLWNQMLLTKKQYNRPFLS